MPAQGCLTVSRGRPGGQRRSQARWEAAVQVPPAGQPSGLRESGVVRDTARPLGRALATAVTANCLTASPFPVVIPRIDCSNSVARTRSALRVNRSPTIGGTAAAVALQRGNQSGDISGDFAEFDQRIGDVCHFPRGLGCG